MLSAPECDHSDFRHNEDSCQAAKWEAICHFTISSHYGHAGHDKWDDVILQSVQTARSFFCAYLTLMRQDLNVCPSLKFEVISHVPRMDGWQPGRQTNKQGQHFLYSHIAVMLVQ